MFCPGCGCLIPDNARICRECGHRITKNERTIASAEQPSEKGFRSDRTPAAVSAVVEPALAVAMGILMLIALFLPWTSDGTTGMQILSHHPYTGSGASLLNTVPIVTAVCALLCPLSVFINRRPLLMVPGGIVLITMAISGIYGHGTGMGIYVTVFCGIIVFIIGLNSNLGRR